jgi:predicted aldo/keto reductase-like oxidoreductase
MNRTAQLHPDLPQVTRLGLATRGNNELRPEDVHHAIDRGINYLNWCGRPDGLSRAIAELGEQRDKAVIAVQLQARDGAGMERQIDRALAELNTDRIDVVTLYYIESQREWDGLIAPGGALIALEAAKQTGAVRMIGLTSHQRTLAAGWAQTGRLDLLMLRYNAAHRGAETEVFPYIRPVTGESTINSRSDGDPDIGASVANEPIKKAPAVPFVAYTCLRWGALMEPTPADPPGFTPPPAREWYRYVLAQPRVDVALMAPRTRAELDHDLPLLDDWRPPNADERAILEAHGERVHTHGEKFV